MLPVDIAQKRRDLPQQRHCYRPVSEKRARLAAGQNLALDQQLAIFHRRARLLQQLQQGRVPGRFKNGRHPRPLGIRTHHVGRRAAAQNQPKCIHHNGFAAPGLARQQVQSGVKLHPDAFHHGVVLHHQFQQHSMKLYEVSLRLKIGGAVHAWPVCVIL